MILYRISFLCVLADSSSSSGPPARWQRKLVSRIVAQSTDGQRLFSFDEMFERMRFLSPAQPLGQQEGGREDQDLLLHAIHIAHVVLDPFPGSNPLRICSSAVEMSNV